MFALGKATIYVFSNEEASEVMKYKYLSKNVEFSFWGNNHAILKLHFY